MTAKTSLKQKVAKGAMWVLCEKLSCQAVGFVVSRITGSWGSGKTEFAESWTNALAKGDNDEKSDYLSAS